MGKSDDFSTADHCNIITTLKKYRDLTSNSKNHPSLIKEKTAILCAATFLESRERDVIRLCLDIIENFVQNDNCHQALIATFGIFEALESLSIRLRGSDSAQANRASVMVDLLRKSAPPAYSTRLRVRGRHARKRTTMYQFYIPNLNYENRRDLEETLVQIKGLVSFVVDFERRRCTVRVTPSLQVEQIVRLLLERCSLKLLVVIRNQQQDMAETYIDVLDDKNRDLTTDYFPEEETPPHGKCVSHFTKMTQNMGDWVKSATNFWNKSFYW